MTNLEAMTMHDIESNGGSILRKAILPFLALIGILFCAGIIVGMLAVHIENGGGALTPKAITILVAATAAIAGIGSYAFRSIKSLLQSRPDLSNREKLNRNIMWACCALGGVIALYLISLRPSNLVGLGAFSDGPVPASAAIFLAAIWGIAMPVIAYFWHKKAIDEQEAAAYRDGAYYAAYAFIIGAPTWWILARGGLAPQIDGVAIFLIFNFIWLGVWFYKKYL